MQDFPGGFAQEVLLDDLVVEATGPQRQEVNNGGMEAQLDYLIGQWGSDEVEAQVEDVIALRKRVCR